MPTFTFFCFIGGFLCGIGFCAALMAALVYIFGT